jgi:hypothetical protein
MNEMIAMPAVTSQGRVRLYVGATCTVLVAITMALSGGCAKAVLGDGKRRRSHAVRLLPLQQAEAK